MLFDDLRGFIDQVDKLGALRRLTGANTQSDIGSVTEVAAGQAECPALLFDDIPGFPHGYRVFTNATITPQRAALALGIDPHLRPIDALKAWKDRRRELRPVAPKEVADAP